LDFNAVRFSILSEGVCTVEFLLFVDYLEAKVAAVETSEATIVIVFYYGLVEVDSQNHLEWL